MKFDHLGDSAEQDPLEPGTLDEGDAFDEFGFAGESGRKRRIGETTIVIFAALLVAAGGLYGMRWLGGQSSTAKVDGAIEAKVEAFLQSIIGSEETVAEAKFQNIDPGAIKGRLTDDRTDKQVPLEDVKQNPFIRLGAGRTDSTAGGAGTPPEEMLSPAELERQRRARVLQRLEEATTDLWVTSIVGREAKRIAQIEFGSAKLHVAVGYKVEIDDETTFVVVRIDALSVLLEAEGFEFTITMGE